MSKHWYGGSDSEFNVWMKKCFNNNYRKMHGLPMKRWCHMQKARNKEFWR